MKSDYIAGLFVGAVGLIVLVLYLKGRGSLPRLNARQASDETNKDRAINVEQKVAAGRSAVVPYEIGSRARSPFDIDLGSNVLQPYQSRAAAQAAAGAPVRPKDSASVSVFTRK